MELFIDPTIFKLGFFELRWYSVAYIVGFISAGLLAFFLNKFALEEQELSKINLDYLINYCIFGVILGGRFGYVIFYEPLFFLQNPLQIFAIWNGGMSFHGGLLGVIIALIFFAKKKTYDVWHLFDRAAICVLPGLFFGRIANFINGELWGKVTTLPIGFIFPASGNFEARHPSQLYEAILEGLLPFIIFLILLKFTKLFQKKIVFTSLFLIFYGSARFIVEAFFREPHGIFEFKLFALSTGQLLSIPMIFLGLILLFLKIQKKAFTSQ
jgi:phosphatidylglycerol:prolipoprotein diacylglycerol transferase